MGKFLSKEKTEEAATEKAPLEVPTEQTPTVLPQAESDFSATNDAKNLNKAFQAAGANESTITGILANRSCEQRQEIKEAYLETFKKTLLSDVDSELSGHYRCAIEWLLMDPDSVRVSYISKVLNDDLISRLTDSRGKDVAILETIFPLTKTELQGLKNTYMEVCSTQLTKDLDTKVTGPFKDWVVSLAQTGRNEGMPSEKAIAKDVTYLKSLTFDLWTPETKELQQIFCQRNLFHIYSVINTYDKETGTKLIKEIQNVKSEFRDGFKVIVSSSTNGYEFYADGLYQSMKGLGTNDDKLIYIMIDRCETDLGNIKVEFEIKYEISLESFIKDDTSGDYKNILIAILDNQQKPPDATAGRGDS